MQQDQQRLRNLLYKVFVSKDMDYDQVKYYQREQLLQLFEDCSYALLDECMDLLCKEEHYEGCAALKLIIDAKLQQQTEALFVAFMAAGR
jgi:hypothetical protein